MNGFARATRTVKFVPEFVLEVVEATKDRCVIRSSASF
jgi:hypothetical protein